MPTLQSVLCFINVAKDIRAASNLSCGAVSSVFTRVVNYLYIYRFYVSYLMLDELGSASTLWLNVLMVKVVSIVLDCLVEGNRATGCS